MDMHVVTGLYRQLYVGQLGVKEEVVVESAFDIARMATGDLALALVGLQHSLRRAHQLPL